MIHNPEVPTSTLETFHSPQIIPALERVLSLVGADVRAWYASLPRPHRLLPQKRPAAALGLQGGGGAKTGASGAGTIDAYYLSRHCAVRLQAAQLGAMSFSS